MIILEDTDFIAKGNERACYLYPENPNKTIKITFENNKRKKNKQSKIEIKYYKQLSKRGFSNWKHLPQYFGEIKTNKGSGFVVELIRDYDGEISKSFEYYLKQNGKQAYEKELNEYKQYFLDNCIICNYGMMPKNILLRKNSENNFDLVLIDGLGDVAHLTIQNKIPYFARKRILRRWEKFIKKYIEL